MMSKRKVVPGSQTQSDRLSGWNVGPFPRHSFLRYNFDYQPFVAPLRINSAGDDEWVDGCFRRREKSSIFVIEFVYAGNMVFRSSGREYLIEPGAAFFVTPGSTTEMQTGPIGFCRKMTVFLSGSMLHTAIRQTGLWGVDTVVLEEPLRFMDIIAAVCRQMKKPTKITALELGDLAWRLLLELASSNKGCQWPDTLQSAIGHIDINVNRQVTLHEICSVCHCSISALSRLFRRYLGISPIEYSIQQRMNLARHLLQTTFLPIKEISLRCGYDNQLYFSMEFRKRFGMSPSSWRSSQLVENRSLK